MFDAIEDLYLNYCPEGTEFLLVGDFNARTGLLNETFTLDQSHEVNSDLYEFELDKREREALLAKHDVPLVRSTNSEKSINRYGERFLLTCQNTGSYIANGRCGSDKGTGMFTCAGTSVVDYVACSPKAMVNITDFNICDYNPLFSDKHNPISLNLGRVAFKNIDQKYSVNKKKITKSSF
ncbi:hypothetical protein SNE40_014150 [Patella caerulea]|uniref:Uncharacterized protein n=1 Tax=Patella caerulea TaxID=87958 RepID=A0AAN8JDD7_PATCE